ncbi:hypothetical protein Cyan10605_1854 [Cyanobacterium aponinum PCC 10605]|uniref:Uncharacterized protein n=1 Tax=Cyanobacterium aponinum (strain PCC 10605) TaxID=755178 RepID=K9Z5V5_CYAAP|nr:hypothetical protein Cyan10605_1854 [Cyanobacterium aponinum PCC 10605]
MQIESNIFGVKKRPYYVMLAFHDPETRKYTDFPMA